MAAAGPGLGAYIQAQKRQKQIEDQLAKANKEEDDSKDEVDGQGGNGKEGGKSKKDDQKEDQNTVAALAKTVAKEVIGTVKAVSGRLGSVAALTGSALPVSSLSLIACCMMVRSPKRRIRARPWTAVSPASSTFQTAMTMSQS